MTTIGALTGIEHPQNSIFLQARLLNELLERLRGVHTEIMGTKRVALSKIWQWVRDERPIIVHYGSFMLAAFRLSRREKVRFVYHNHTPLRLYWKWDPLVVLLDLSTEVQLRLLPRNMPWVAVSAFNATCLRKLGFTNVMECPLIVENEPAGEKASKTSIPTVIYVGRILPHKQCIELIREMNRAAELYGNRVRLEIVGDGKAGSRYLREFKKTVESMQGSGSLEVVWSSDPLPRRELRERYERAWLYASLSLHEGFGLPACEAVLAGTPALYLESGGQESVLNGFGVVRLQNQGEFAARVVTLLQDEGKRRQLWAEQAGPASRYRIDAIAPRALAAYGGLLTQNAGRGAG